MNSSRHTVLYMKHIKHYTVCVQAKYNQGRLNTEIVCIDFWYVEVVYNMCFLCHITSSGVMVGKASRNMRAISWRLRGPSLGRMFVMRQGPGQFRPVGLYGRFKLDNTSFLSAYFCMLRVELYQGSTMLSANERISFHLNHANKQKIP